MRVDFRWVYTTILIPYASLLLEGAYRISLLLKPRSLQEQLEEIELHQATEDARLSSQASKQKSIPAARGHLRLGVFIKGDHFPSHLGISTQNHWLLMDEAVLDQHILVLGTTGAGKSEALKRLVNEIFLVTNRNLYFVDGKGDERLADDIRSLAHHHGRGLAPVFRLGFDQHGAVYDAFRGGASDIYNRLCALVGVSEAEGDAVYYADINRDLLQLICYAPVGPPRSFEDIRVRLKRDWLEAAYQHDADELETIDQELTDRDILGLSRRIRPLAREFGVCIGNDGFALEHTQCAIFSMRTQSVGDTSRRFINFLVEDLKDFIGKRQRQPAVLVIDEFGQFSNESITSLLSLARSSQLGIILSTQDIASLRGEATKKLILANTRTKLLMASDFPEDVASLAGTAYQIEDSLQYQEGDATGLGSARVQHAFKIDMNEVAKLTPGQAYLIRQRYAAKIQVKKISTDSNY